MIYSLSATQMPKATINLGSFQFGLVSGDLDKEAHYYSGIFCNMAAKRGRPEPW